MPSLFVILFFFPAFGVALLVPRPLLNTADNFALLAPNTVTCTLADTIYGSIGIGNPGGTIGACIVVPPDVKRINDASAQQAYSDFQSALTTTWGLRGMGAFSLGGTADISSRTFLAGVYMTTTTLAVATGYVRMDAQNDAAAVFVFIAVKPRSLTYHHEHCQFLTPIM
jgi:hypothetical protein